MGRQVKVKLERGGGRGRSLRTTGRCINILGIIKIGNCGVARGHSKGKNKWKKKHGHHKHHWWNDREDHWWDEGERRWKPHNKPDRTYERWQHRASGPEVARQYGLTYYKDDYGLDYMRGLTVRVV